MKNRFSANLGFLWTDIPLPDAIRAAYAAGFDAVECHWPYDIPAAAILRALEETGLPLLGLNTRPGDFGKNELGLSALPGREADARAAIDEAVTYGASLNAKSVHVMAGFASGAAAAATYLSNISYACQQADLHDMTVLIEPLNNYDTPGYFLNSTEQAVEIIEEIDAPNLKLMFDCYHVQLLEGDLTHRLARLMPMIGHIQFAGVPDRGRPDEGELNYKYLFKVIRDLGYRGPLGAEYRPASDTEASLAWMEKLR